MQLSITDPAFLFPGISLLFLAYTNRYLSLAAIIRSLNTDAKGEDAENRMLQIQSLTLRIKLIKYMQAAAAAAFLICIAAMLALIFHQMILGQWLFVTSLFAMTASLIVCIIEILQSDVSLRIELARTASK